MPNMYENELKHYGVMGMHCGVRRYQPYPAAYDGDGKYIGDKALKKKVKADEKRVYNAVRDATILGQAMLRGKKQVKKAREKLSRVSETDDDKKKTSAELNVAVRQKAYRNLRREYGKAEKLAQNMVAEFKKEYGQKNVRDILYKTTEDGRQVVSDQVNTGAKIAVGILAAAALMPFPGTGAAIAAVLPRTKKSKGRQRFNKEVRMVRRQLKERTDSHKEGNAEKVIADLRDRLIRSRPAISN